MKRDETVYLRHILDAVSTIAEYLQGVPEEDFKRNRLLQDGVIRQLQIVGEMTKRLSGDFRAAHPNIPWQDIAGMRASSRSYQTDVSPGPFASEQS